MNLFSKAFFLAALETALSAAASSFAGALVFTGGSPSLKGLAAAGVGAGIAFLYSFSKQYGAVQASRSTAGRQG